MAPNTRRSVPSKYLCMGLLALVWYLSLVFTLIWYKTHPSAFLRTENDSHTPDSDSVLSIYRHIPVNYPEIKPLSEYSISSVNPSGDGLEYTYPQYKPLLRILEAWHPDHPDPPKSYTFSETLQHFNYSDPRERTMAEEYRNAELPFKLYGIPDIDIASKRWSNKYLSKYLSRVTPHVEESSNNHFMYWKQVKTKTDTNYNPPTTVVDMSFDQWLSLAATADKSKLSETDVHYYYMIGVSQKDNTFVNKDLEIFSAKKPNFFITNPKANKGIQCRFGMRGVIAEAHYDSGRNMVAMIKGSKRYILTPPSSCKKLSIIADPSHPSYRHSSIDWSNLDSARSSNFNDVSAIDTIVQQGEVLYIPSYWFHYIVSLQFSAQCNSRSGPPPSEIGQRDINACFANSTETMGKLKRLHGIAPLLNNNKKCLRISKSKQA